MSKPEPVTITALQVERFKRITAVLLKPTAKGLTIIGGKNRQGKTSALDAVIYALGGEKRRPTDAKHRDSKEPLAIRLELSNGLIVERKGKNSALHVTDSDGLSGNQTILNKFVEQLALDLPAFMGKTPKEKAVQLLKIVGVNDKLETLETDEVKAFTARRDANRDYETLRTQLEGMAVFPDAPDILVVLADIAEEIRAAEEAAGHVEGLARQIATYRSDMEAIERKIVERRDAIAEHQKRVEDLEAEIISGKKVCDRIRENIKTHADQKAKVTVPDIEPLQAKLAEAEVVNEQVRSNLLVKEKEKGVLTARDSAAAYATALDRVRDDKAKLLTDAKMPLPGLAIVDGELRYNDAAWDGMSKAERMMVATCIVRQLKPECGFVLLDNLESMDVDTVQEFGEWAESEDLQIIATRVSTGDECSIIIEDGKVV